MKDVENNSTIIGTNPATSNNYNKFEWAKHFNENAEIRKFLMVQCLGLQALIAEDAVSIPGQ